MKQRLNVWAIAAYVALALVIVVSVARRLTTSAAVAPELERTSWEESFPPPLDPLAPSPIARRYVSWCEVREVLQQRCQRCHASPLTNGAPFPLLEYEDTRRERPVGSGQPLIARMQHVVRHRIMPPVELELEPPVEPLSEEQKDVLLVWLEQGALPYGGSNCQVERRVASGNVRAAEARPARD